MTEINRPSVYLSNKSTSLFEAFKFFTEEGAPTQRQLAFLAQIDFWEWEIENLIYSFESFEDRATSWSSNSAITESLSKNGLMVRTSALKKTTKTRERSPSFGYKVVAPIDLLNKTVAEWNVLLKKCELLLDKKNAEAGIEFGAKLQKDLKAYFKQVK